MKVIDAHSAYQTSNTDTAGYLSARGVPFAGKQGFIYFQNLNTGKTHLVWEFAITHDGHSTKDLAANFQANPTASEHKPYLAAAKNDAAYLRQKIQQTQPMQRLEADGQTHLAVKGTQRYKKLLSKHSHLIHPSHDA